jgi:hypothetical protein
MKLVEVEKHYRVCYRHNPKHFFPNSFGVVGMNGRIYLVARVKPKVKKRFWIVAVLKER